MIHFCSIVAKHVYKLFYDSFALSVFILIVIGSRARDLMTGVSQPITIARLAAWSPSQLSVPNEQQYCEITQTSTLSSSVRTLPSAGVPSLISMLIRTCLSKRARYIAYYPNGQRMSECVSVFCKCVLQYRVYVTVQINTNTCHSGWTQQTLAFRPAAVQHLFACIIITCITSTEHRPPVAVRLAGLIICASSAETSELC